MNQNLKAGRIRELDGLRALSVLLVIIGHCIRHIFIPNSATYIIWTNAGSTGVFIFFVISGYIITSLFIKEQNITGTISIKNFYLRRIFRIIPSYYFYLLVVFLLSRYAIISFINPNEFIFSAAFLTNVHTSVGWFLVHTWSLSTEEQYYIFFPLCFIFGIRYFENKFIIFLWIAIFAIWGGLAAIKWTGICSPFFDFNWIIAGACASIFQSKIESLLLKIKFHIVWFLVIILFLLPLVHLPKGSGIIEIPFSCIVLAVFLLKSIHAKGLWQKILLNPIIQWIGLSSYSIYLWQELFTLHPSIIWTTFGIIGCSAFSYYLIEKPFNKIGRNFISSTHSTRTAEFSGESFQAIEEKN